MPWATNRFDSRRNGLAVGFSCQRPDSISKHIRIGIRRLLSQALDRTRWPRVPANTTPDPFGGAEATRDQTRPEIGKEVDHRFRRLALLWGLASRRLGFHHLGIQENAKDFLRRFPDLLQQPRTLLF